MSKSSRLRLRLFPRAEIAVKRGHPWIFADSIKEQNREGEMGELAVVYDRRDRFLAVGLMDPDSPIRVRVLQSGQAATIDREWWLRKARECQQVRQGYFENAATTGMRLIHGENDGFPGLVVDRYGDTLVVKLYTAAWLAHWEQMESVIREVFAPRCLVLRLSRNIQAKAQSVFGVVEGFLGDVGEDVVVFEENGIRFESQVRHGQKTGFFLDQRENRARVEAMASGRDVLNVFSFSGGFSLYAARGGAKSVTDVDISAHALEAAKRNVQLNASDARISQVPHVQVQADAFKWFEEARQEYDLIIVDPPSLAKRESERERAIHAYEKLNAAAMDRLRPKGILVAASCSAHVSTEEFVSLVSRVAMRCGRPWKLLWKHEHAADHPVRFPEAAYLKAVAIALD